MSRDSPFYKTHSPQNSQNPGSLGPALRLGSVVLGAVEFRWSVYTFNRSVKASLVASLLGNHTCYFIIR